MTPEHSQKCLDSLECTKPYSCRFCATPLTISFSHRGLQLQAVQGVRVVVGYMQHRIGFLWYQVGTPDLLLQGSGGLWLQPDVLGEVAV